MTLSKGASGEAVKQLQTALTELNYTFKATRTDPRGIDGIFGADTENKVKLFQMNHGLTPDGIWKAADQAKLEALLAETHPEQQPTVTTDIGELVTEMEGHAQRMIALCKAIKGAS